MVTETTPTGRKQVIKLPNSIDPYNARFEDKKVIRAEEIKTIEKRHIKLKDYLKKGYTTVYECKASWS